MQIQFCILKLIRLINSACTSDVESVQIVWNKNGLGRKKNCVAMVIAKAVKWLSNGFYFLGGHLNHTGLFRMWEIGLRENAVRRGGGCDVAFRGGKVLKWIICWFFLVAFVEKIANFPAFFLLFDRYFVYCWYQPVPDNGDLWLFLKWLKIQFSKPKLSIFTKT